MIFRRIVRFLSVFVAGTVAGGLLFGGLRSRPFLTVERCGTSCLDEKELRGLIGSVITRLAPGLLPEVLLETDRTVAIRHHYPKSPVHYVIIPKKDIKDVGDLAAGDEPYLADAYAVMQSLIEHDQLINYRIHTNGPGYQDVRYLHFHLRADRSAVDTGGED
ncbi:MAG: HIT-like protein [Candidatus Peregrinibacteria bacterium Greene0416_19]|nr:MAG: HIT-like protein [Candidatus Peregrinibacteria bacterium Greene0416_19]